MSLAYFDSSALVKLMIAEEGSKLAIDIWNASGSVLASRIAYPEVRAALAAAARNHQITEDTLNRLERTWDEYWAAIRPVEVTQAVEQRAGSLTRLHSLKGADAVHLASALAINDPDLVMAVWDRRLHAGARAAGTAVAPAELED